MARRGKIIDNMRVSKAGETKAQRAPGEMKVWETGRYGRPVVKAYLPDGTDVHEAMIRQGWAIAYRKYLPEPLRPAYLAAEVEAKSARRGLWQGKFIVPTKWRRGDRLACEKRARRR